MSKLLTVDYNYNEPKFVFEGTWNGHDIKVVSNLMRRAYLRHQQSIRRSEEVTTVPNEKGE